MSPNSVTPTADTGEIAQFHTDPQPENPSGPPPRTLDAAHLRAPGPSPLPPKVAESSAPRSVATLPLRPPSNDKKDYPQWVNDIKRSVVASLKACVDAYADGKVEASFGLPLPTPALTAKTEGFAETVAQTRRSVRGDLNGRPGLLASIVSAKKAGEADALQSLRGVNQDLKTFGKAYQKMAEADALAKEARQMLHPYMVKGAKNQWRVKQLDDETRRNLGTVPYDILDLLDRAHRALDEAHACADSGLPHLRTYANGKKIGLEDDWRSHLDGAAKALVPVLADTEALALVLQGRRLMHEIDDIARGLTDIQNRAKREHVDAGGEFGRQAIVLRGSLEQDLDDRLQEAAAHDGRLEAFASRIESGRSRFESMQNRFDAKLDASLGELAGISIRDNLLALRCHDMRRTFTSGFWLTASSRHRLDQFEDVAFRMHDRVQTLIKNIEHCVIDKAPGGAKSKVPEQIRPYVLELLAQRFDDIETDLAYLENHARQYDSRYVPSVLENAVGTTLAQGVEWLIGKRAPQDGIRWLSPDMLENSLGHYAATAGRIKRDVRAVSDSEAEAEQKKIDAEQKKKDTERAALRERLNARRREVAERSGRKILPRSGAGRPSESQQVGGGNDAGPNAWLNDPQLMREALDYAVKNLQGFEEEEEATHAVDLSWIDDGESSSTARASRQRTQPSSNRPSANTRRPQPAPSTESAAGAGPSAAELLEDAYQAVSRLDDEMSELRTSPRAEADALLASARSKVGSGGLRLLAANTVFGHFMKASGKLKTGVELAQRKSAWLAGLAETIRANEKNPAKRDEALPRIAENRRALAQLARDFAAEVDGAIHDEAVAARFATNLKAFAQRPRSGLFTWLINNPGEGIASIERTQHRMYSRRPLRDGRVVDDYRDEFILRLKEPQTITYIDAQSGKPVVATVEFVALHVHYPTPDATRFDACHFKIEPQYRDPTPIVDSSTPEEARPKGFIYRSDDEPSTMRAVLRTVHAMAGIV